MKRLIAVLLSVAMVIGSFGIFAFAGGPEFDYQITEVRKLTGDNTFTELDGAAKPGDILVLTVALTNNSSDPFEFKGFSVFIGYDNSFVEPYNGMQPFKKNPFAQNTEDLINDLYWSPAGHSNVAEHYVSVAAGGADAYELAIGETLDCCYVAFKVKTGVESGTALFAMVEGKDNSITPSSGALADFAAKTVSISGIAPTLNEVAVDSISITVNGLTGATAALSAGSVMGTNVTSSVAWTVDPANQGVTVSADGTVTADAKATAGTYTFTATPDGTNVLGTAKSTTLTVNRTAATVTSIEVSLDKSEVTADGTNDATITPTVSGKDQYGDDITPSGVVWSLDGTLTGVSINDSTGIVTVAKNAAEGIIRIKATANEKVDTATLVVSRNTAAVSVASIGFDKESVTADGTNDVVVTPSIKALDQYGEAITPTSVEWSLDGTYNGVSIDASTGVVTVSKKAEVNTVKVKVTADGKTTTSSFTVSRNESVPTKITIKKSGNAVESADSIIIPVEGAANNTYEYSAVVTDQYDDVVRSAVTKWTFETADSYVTFSSGIVTVKNGATKDATYTLKASSGKLNATVTLTAKDIYITWPTATIKDAPTYGDTWAEIVSINSDGSASLNSTVVPGTFSLKTTGTPAAGSETYVVTFTSEDGVYSVDKTYDAVVISPLEVELEWSGFTTRTYDGSQSAVSAIVSNKVGSDVVTVTVTNGDQINAGTYTATASGLDGADKDNYKLPDTAPSKEYTIAPKELSVTWSGYENLVYDGNAKTVTASPVGLVSGDVVTVTVTGGNKTDAGTYTAIASGLAGAAAANYKLPATAPTQSYTIAQNEATLEWSGYTGLVYDGTAKNVTATVTNLLGSDTCTVTVTGGTETNAGSYTATATELSNSNYKLPEIVTQGYTIAKATRTATASPAAITLNKDNNFTAKLQFADLDGEAAPVAYVTPAAIAVVDGLTVTAVTTGSAIITVEIPESDNYNEQTKIGFSVTVVAAADKISVVYTMDNGKVNTVEYDIEDTETELPSDTRSGYSFSGWTYDGSAVFKLEDITKAENAGKIFFASPVFQEVRHIPSTPKTTGTESVTIKGNTATVKSIDTGALETGKPVTLDFTQSKTEVKEVQLAAETVKAIAEASDEGVEIKLADAEVKLDAAAMESIAAALNGADMSLVVNVGSDVKKTMTSEQNKVIGAMKDTVVISASITSGGKNVSDFGGGSVDLTVDYKWNGKGVLRAAFIAADGTVEIVPVKFKDGKATITVKHFSDYVIYTEDALPFKDVEETQWSANAIGYCVSKDLFAGYEDGTFRAANNVTRAMVMTILAKYDGAELTAAEDESWYQPFVDWAVENKVSDGTNPENDITREQLVVMMWNFTGCPESSYDLSAFVDVASIDDWALPAVRWAVERGLIVGRPGNVIDPLGNATREEFAQIMYNYCEVVK